MATDQERLVLQMSADLRSFEREMARARTVTERRMREVEQAAVRADKNLSRIMKQAGSNATDALRSGLTGIAPTLAAAFSAQQVVAYADAWTNGRNALAAAGVATEDLAQRQSELVDLANETRTSMETTVALYRRLSIANEELGLSSAQVLRITELLNKSFVTSGASTQEAAAAALQLSQALASGVLQGDELRSIRENAPQIAQAIARAMGVGIGELKKLGAEGKITADVVAGAILAAGDKIEAKFATTTATVGQALQILNNELGRYIGQSDASASASQRVAQAIVSLADNLDSLVPILGVLVSLVGTKMVLALTANSGAMIANGVAAVRLAAFQTAMTASMTGTTRATLLATTAMRGFGAALAANPLGAAIVAIAALSAGLVYLAEKSDKAKQAQAELNGVVAAADEAIGAYETALADAATKSGVAREAALKHADALRTLAADAVFAAEVLAEQRVQQTKLAAEEARAAAAKAARTDRQSRTGSGGGTPGVNVLQSANALASGAADRDLAFAIEAELKAVQELGKARERLNRLTTGGAAAFAPRAASGGSSSTRAGATPARDTSKADEERTAALREGLALEEAMLTARATGDEAAIRAEERRQELVKLTERYRAAGFDDAEARAENLIRLEERGAEQVAAREQLAEFMRTVEEVHAAYDEMLNQTIDGILEAAERQQREMFEGTRDGILDGLYAASQGNFAEFLADRLRRAVFESVADGIAQALTQNGGSKLLDLGASIFGGFRAGGGPVSAGRAYVVGEKRPEVFVPNVSGTILPSVNAATQMAGRGPTVSPQAILKMEVNVVGAIGQEGIAAIARREARVGAAMAVDAAKRGYPVVQERQRRLGTP